MLVMLGVLAAGSLLASALPVWASGCGATLVLVYSTWAARRYLRQPRRMLVIAGGQTPPQLDGVTLVRFSLQWRGTLAFLAWQDVPGARGHLVWWPDTLDARQRRELHLAAGNVPVSANGVAMAP